MGKRYHINPDTGVPSICRATNNQCPYGGKTGNSNHFDNYGSAQEAAQLLLESKHGLLPSNDELTRLSIDYNNNSRIYEEYDLSNQLTGGYEFTGDGYGGYKFGGNKIGGYNIDDYMEDDLDDGEYSLNDYMNECDYIDYGEDDDDDDEYSVEDYIRDEDIYEESFFDQDGEVNLALVTTEDQDVINGVLEGKMHAHTGWDKISLVLQNANLSRGFIEELINNPEEYNVESIKWLMNNPALTHEDIMKVINSNDDLEVQSLALRNSSLDLSFAEDFLANRPAELTRLPWLAMAHNEKTAGSKSFIDWKVKCVKKGISTDREKMSYLNSKYPNWLVRYERNK